MFQNTVLLKGKALLQLTYVSLIIHLTHDRIDVYISAKISYHLVSDLSLLAVFSEPFFVLIVAKKNWSSRSFQCPNCFDVTTKTHRTESTCHSPDQICC